MSTRAARGLPARSMINESPRIETSFKSWPKFCRAFMAEIFFSMAIAFSSLIVMADMTIIVDGG